MKRYGPKYLSDKISHLLVGVCYQSPNASDKKSDNLLKSIENAANSCAIIFGDFNYLNIKWKKLDAYCTSKHSLNKVTNLFLTQHVKQPTRWPNSLDLVFTTEPEMVNDVEVREHLTNCDNNFLTWELACDATWRLNSNRLNYIFHKEDYEGFRSFLTNISWEEVLSDFASLQSWELSYKKML